MNIKSIPTNMPPKAAINTETALGNQLDVKNIVPPKRQLHADSGISDTEFRKYDTKMYRSRGLRNIAHTLGLGAMYARGLAESKALAYWQGMPRTVENLAKARKASKWLSLGALGTMTASRALKYNAMRHDPEYRNKSAIYRAAADILNPPTDLEGYYAEYSRPVVPFATQNNLYKRASTVDGQGIAGVTALGGIVSFVPWKLKRMGVNMLWKQSEPARDNISTFGKKIIQTPEMRAAKAQTLKALQKLK